MERSYQSAASRTSWWPHDVRSLKACINADGRYMGRCPLPRDTRPLVAVNSDLVVSAGTAAYPGPVSMELLMQSANAAGDERIIC